jgi:hypothetical protein
MSSREGSRQGVCLFSVRHSARTVAVEEEHGSVAACWWRYCEQARGGGVLLSLAAVCKLYVVQREPTAPGGPGSGLCPGRKCFLWQLQLPLWPYIFRCDARRLNLHLCS